MIVKESKDGKFGIDALRGDEWLWFEDLENGGRFYGIPYRFNKFAEGYDKTLAFFEAMLEQYDNGILNLLALKEGEKGVRIQKEANKNLVNMPGDVIDLNGVKIGDGCYRKVEILSGVWGVIAAFARPESYNGGIESDNWYLKLINLDTREEKEIKQRFFSEFYLPYQKPIKQFILDQTLLFK